MSGATREVASGRAGATARSPAWTRERTAWPSGRPQARELVVEVRPRWPLRLPRFTGHDRLAVLRGGVLHRLLFVGEGAVLVRATVLSGGSVLFSARAHDRRAAREGIQRMRTALGVDQDLRPFHERFRRDPLIGAALVDDPGLRVPGRPTPFEALALAICEQLIDARRAGAIQRRLIAALGRRCRETGMCDAPSPEAIVASSPALLCSFGLAEGRARALVAAAREVASGRVDLSDSEHERGWQRLARIPGIGSWTLQRLALHGQARLDQLPAGDLAYRKLVGRMLSGGDPFARASEQQVAVLFSRYQPWSGLAGLYALRAQAHPPCAGTSSIASVSHGASASAPCSSWTSR